MKTTFLVYYRPQAITPANYCTPSPRARESFPFFYERVHVRDRYVPCMHGLVPELLVKVTETGSVKILRSDFFARRPIPRRHGYIAWRRRLGRHGRMTP
jgi:hypothetical protein